MLHNEIIQTTYNLPVYFMQNELINNNKIFLAQYIGTSLLTAINVSVNWNINKFNMVINNDVKDDLLYTLYVYNGKNNIQKHIIKGIPNNYDINIIGHVIYPRNIITYTVILKLI